MKKKGERRDRYHRKYGESCECKLRRIEVFVKDMVDAISHCHANLYEYGDNDGGHLALTPQIHKQPRIYKGARVFSRA